MFVLAPERKPLGKYAPSTYVSVKPRILIVDDDEVVRRMLSLLLRNVGEILIAGSAQEGLELLEAHENQVDLVLCDQLMPGMTGDRMLAEVTRRWPRTERVLMSGYSDVVPVNRGLENGEIGHFVAKPWDNRVLIDEITNRAARALAQRNGKTGGETLPSEGEPPTP